MFLEKLNHRKSLQLRLRNLNICIEKVQPKCWNSRDVVASSPSFSRPAASAPQRALLAGRYPAGTISHFSKSADDYWYSLFTPSKWPHFNICKLYPSLILPDIYACARRRVSLWHWRLFTQSLHQSLRILWLRMSLCPQSGTLAVLVENPDVQDCQAASDLLYVI